MHPPSNKIDEFQNSDEPNVLVDYRGAFVESVLDEIGNEILRMFSTDMITGKRVFSVFIEVAQNIAIHSAEHNILSRSRKTGNGSLRLSENVNSYTITAANLISNEAAADMLSKSNLINSLDREGLRKLKIQLLSMPVRENQKGGNIGLVDIALKARNQLKVEITPINEHFSSYVLSVNISKMAMVH